MGSIPGVGDGSPCQYYHLENPMDRGAWWAVAHRVAESWTQLSAHTQTHTVRRLLMESHTFAKIRWIDFYVYSAQAQSALRHFHRQLKKTRVIG